MSKKQMIRRRGLSAFLAMAMCFGLLPATAWAVEPDDAALVTAAEQDGTDVPAAAEPDGIDPSQPAEYRLVYNSGDGKLYKEYPDRSRAAYTAQAEHWTGLDQDNDGTFETLQLNGFRFYSNHKCDESNNGMGIMHPALETLPDSVKLDIEGENVIFYNAGGDMAYGGVLSTRNATVTGDGTIRLTAANAKAPRAWKATNGLAVQGNTKIVLNAESTSENAYGIEGNQNLSVAAGSRMEISVTTNSGTTPGTAIVLSHGFIIADDSVVDGANETFISGVSGASGSTNNWVNNFKLTQKDTENPVIIRDRTEAERTSQEIHYSWADGKLGDKEFDDLSTHGQLTFTANGESKIIEQIRMRSPGLSKLRAGDVVTVSVDPAEGYTLTGWMLVMGDTFNDYESAEKYSVDTNDNLRFIMPNKNIYAVAAHFDMNENARVAVYETVFKFEFWEGYDYINRYESAYLTVKVKLQQVRRTS